MIDPPTDEIVEKKMIELADKIGYHYRDLTHLKNAMFTKKIGSTAKPNYTNSSLATVGDVVIKLIIADDYYQDGKTRGDITVDKSKMECNTKLYEVSERLGLCHYAYRNDCFFDDAPDHLKFPSGEHDLYLEAVTGAVFHDLGYEGCRDWFKNNIMDYLRN